MILTNEFVVEAPVDRVWSLLDEVESVMTCMPGASYTGRDGDDHKVHIKVKVGAISANFQGTVRFVEKNEAKRTARIHGVGKDLGGKASATATISAKLEPLSAARTKVLVSTDLAMTGRLAQFGGGVMADIASRMIEQFTQNLHAAVIAQSTNSSPAIEPGAATADKEKIVIAQNETATARKEAATGNKESAAFDLAPVLRKRALMSAAILVAFIILVTLLARYL